MSFLTGKKFYLFVGALLICLFIALNITHYRLKKSQAKLEKEKVLVMTEYTKEQENKLNEDEQTIKTALKESDCSRVNLPLDVIKRLQ